MHSHPKYTTVGRLPDKDSLSLKQLIVLRTTKALDKMNKKDKPPVVRLSWAAAQEPAQLLPSVHRLAGAPQSSQQSDAAEFDVMVPALLHLAVARLPAKACCMCLDNQAAACRKL